MRKAMLIVLATAALASCGLPPDIVGPTSPRDPGAPQQPPPNPGG